MPKRSYSMQRRAALEADTRERIVRATVALHAEHGALGTSYAMIAKRAQVAPQTVYNHFPELGALFGACTGHVLDQAPPLDAETFRSGRSPAARLRLLAQAVFARHDFLAPWMRIGWHEAALIPALGASSPKARRPSPAHRSRGRPGPRADRRLRRCSLRTPRLSSLARTHSLSIESRGGSHRRLLRPIFSPASPAPNPERESHERPKSRFFYPCRRDRRRDFPDQHSRPSERCPRRLYLQSVLDSRCGAASVPHRSAHVVRSGARGHRARHPGGDAPVHFLLARRGGRVWFAQSVSRRRAAGCAPLRPGGGNGVDWGSGRPPAPGACGSGAPHARTAYGAVDRRAASAHGWECGFLPTPRRVPSSVRPVTQFGERHPAITETDILEPSEAARIGMDYYAHSPAASRLLERLANTASATLACMHGPAWRGDGAALLRSLASRLAPAPTQH